MPSEERFRGANMLDAGRLSPYWGEHVARYVFASQFVDQKRVLDIACGTGYGIGLLRAKAKFIVGVDIDAEAAKDARGECGENAAVLLADGLGLPFSNDAFEVVTSFETLEHLYRRGEFLSELSRVMRPGAILILSTPNAAYTMPVEGKPSNPFHIYEYTADELRTELGNHFAIDEFLGQTLNIENQIPPFYEAQRRLPRDSRTQMKLFGWKVFNKFPLSAREWLSKTIWGKPFYPTEMDYNFDETKLGTAPVLLAVCHKE